MRRFLTTALSTVPAAFVLFATAPTTLAGQMPVSANPAALTGTVRGEHGAPLALVSVTLIGESVSTRTDSAGVFALKNVPPGSHTVLFRRIGFRSVERRWVAQSGDHCDVAVTMVPLPPQLDRVVVEAARTTRMRGTSSIVGSVVDSVGRPVANADVRLLASGLSTATDSAGRFEFRSLAAGSYILRVRRHGLRSANAVMQIVDDDDRGISIKQFNLPVKTSERDRAAASGYGVADSGFDEFDYRGRTRLPSAVFGPADLFQANGKSLDLVLEQFRDVPSADTRRVRSLAAATDEGDCLLIDGRRPIRRPLNSFLASDLQLIEVYRRNALVDSYLASQMSGLAHCGGTVDRHPVYFVLWTRALR